MNQEYRSWLLTQHQRWQATLALAQRKPWLANYLLRRMQQCREQMAEQLKRLGLLLNLYHPRQLRRWLQRKAGPAIVGGGLILALNFGLAHAGTITVTTTDDVLNMEDGMCSLREAVLRINSGGLIENDCTFVGPPGVNDTIVLPTGTIAFTIDGPNEDGAYSGDLDIASGRSVTISGQGLNQSIIDGNRLDRVLHIHPGATLSLADLTIQGGETFIESGVGILNHNGNLILTNSKVTGNSMTGGIEGEGAYGSIEPNQAPLPRRLSSPEARTNPQNSNLSGTWHGQLNPIPHRRGSTNSVRVNRTTETQDIGISSMMTLNGYGSGISNQAIGGTASMTLTNSLVLSNTGAYRGGGIANDTAGGTVSAVVTGSTISGNNAFSGAGIENGAYVGSVNLDIVDSTISGNQALFGGGIDNYGYYYGTSQVNISNSTISGNQALYGGGISNFSYDYGAANLNLTRSTISGNLVDGIGGGVFNVSNYESTTALTMTNSVVMSNTANFVGGGLATFAYDNATATADVTNSVIGGNSASSGGQESLTLLRLMQILRLK